MKNAYLILAHTQPELLKKILFHLDDKDNDFFVHLDARSDLRADDFRQCITKGGLYFTERIPVTWGDFSMVAAEYVLLEAALSKGCYDYYHLISGQDFPLKTVSQINAFLTENYGKEFVHFGNDSFSERVYVNRYVVKHPLLRFCGRTRNAMFYLNAVLVRLQKCFYSVATPTWSAEKYLVGSQFFSITHALATFLLAAKEDVFKTYKYTLIPDEAVIQTLVYQSEFRERLYVKEHTGSMRGNMRYIDWSGGTDGSPRTITRECLPDVIDSGMLFARKVDMVHHPDVIALLEEHLEQEKRV